VIELFGGILFNSLAVSRSALITVLGWLNRKVLNILMVYTVLYYYYRKSISMLVTQIYRARRRLLFTPLLKPFTSGTLVGEVSMMGGTSYCVYPTFTSLDSPNVVQQTSFLC